MSTQSHQTIQETAVSVIQELSTIVYPTYPTEKELLWTALELRLGRKLHPKWTESYVIQELLGVITDEDAKRLNNDLKLRLGRKPKPSERVLSSKQLERIRLHRIQMEIDHIKVLELRESWR